MHPADAEHENRVERPPLFPPTFLYTQSWEDPEPDMKVGGLRVEGATWGFLAGSLVPSNVGLAWQYVRRYKQL